MKKLSILLIFFSSVFVFAQSDYSVKEVERSTDPKVIANFIKYNPKHPRTPEFKRKLIAVINNNHSSKDRSEVAKPTVRSINASKLKTEVRRDVAKDGVNQQNKRTEDLLNHMFNTDPNSKSAYVQIVNKSKCNLIVKINGKRFYNLAVPAHNQNFLLLDKGVYSVTTSVCDAKYSSRKQIYKDIVITLNAPR